MGDLYKGWDIFTPDPGKIDSMRCRVCDQEMLIKRDAIGPTSWVEAISGGNHKHDQFTCKNVNADWHIQVRKLKQEIEKTPSKKLAALYQEEIEEILTSYKIPENENRDEYILENFVIH